MRYGPKPVLQLVDVLTGHLWSSREEFSPEGIDTAVLLIERGLSVKEGEWIVRGGTTAPVPKGCAIAQVLA